MLKHYLTQYGETENGKGIGWFACSWIQLNIFGKCICFNVKKEQISPPTEYAAEFPAV